MRNFALILMTLVVALMSIAIAIQDVHIKNLELKYCKLERACSIIIEENKSLRRQVDLDLRLMSEGGWK